MSAWHSRWRTGPGWVAASLAAWLALPCLGSAFLRLHHHHHQHHTFPRRPTPLPPLCGVVLDIGKDVRSVVQCWTWLGRLRSAVRPAERNRLSCPPWPPLLLITILDGSDVLSSIFSYSNRPACALQIFSGHGGVLACGDAQSPLGQAHPSAASLTRDSSSDSNILTTRIQEQLSLQPSAQQPRAFPPRRWARRGVTATPPPEPPPRPAQHLHSWTTDPVSGTDHISRRSYIS